MRAKKGHVPFPFNVNPKDINGKRCVKELGPVLTRLNREIWIAKRGQAGFPLISKSRNRIVTTYQEGLCEGAFSLFVLIFFSFYLMFF